MDLFLLLLLTRLLPLEPIVVTPSMYSPLMQVMCKRFEDGFQQSITAAAGGEIRMPGMRTVDLAFHSLKVFRRNHTMKGVPSCRAIEEHSASASTSSKTTLRRTRCLPPPSLDAFKKVDGRRSRWLHEGTLAKGLVHHIPWAGCRPDQTSADANMGGSWYGAFTYYFCKELRAGKNSQSRKALLKKVRSDLTAGHYTQIPQLECQATVRKARILAPGTEKAKKSKIDKNINP